MANTHTVKSPLRLVDMSEPIIEDSKLGGDAFDVFHGIASLEQMPPRFLLSPNKSGRWLVRVVGCLPTVPDRIRTNKSSSVIMLWSQKPHAVLFPGRG